MSYFLKELGKALIVGTSIFLVFLIIYFFMGRPINLNEDLAHEYGLNLMYTVILYMLNTAVYRYFWTRFKDRLFSAAHLTRAMLGSIGISILGIFICRLIEAIFIERVAFSTFIAGERIQYYFVSLIISIVITAIFYFFYYYRCQKEKQVKEQKIIARTASAQFDALKNQLDPHFLFNSLNVLTSLIEENPDQAMKFTTSLSKVYRYVLEQKNKELVTVNEELAFAKTYMTLIKMRYEDSIIVKIPEKSVDPEAKVVPLSLQLLLENAVKHNRVTPADKLTIEITEASGFLQVKNNLQEKQVIKKSSGVGLYNIKQRYALLTKRPVLIEKDARDFRVSVPLLTKQAASTVKISQVYLDEKRYARAKEHVEKVKGFYGNLTAYCIVIPFLVILNLVTTSFLWVIFPIAGWGLGLFFHGMEAFDWSPLWGKKWEARKIREIMEKDNLE